jgi:hypothetical protein
MVNVWKARVNRLVSLCCPLCTIGEESIIDKFWECNTPNVLGATHKRL